MRKSLVILGFLIGTPLLGGVAYLVGSKAAAGSTVKAKEETLIRFDDLMTEALLCRSQRRFGDAERFARQAIDHADSKQMRAAAGFLMGQVMLEEWHNGEKVSLDAAVAYLNASRKLSDSPRQRADIDMVLLDVLSAIGEAGKYVECLDHMLAQATAPEEQIALWRRRFEYLLGPNGDWNQMDMALKEAGYLSLDWIEWRELLADMQLQVKERVLENPHWFDTFIATTRPPNPEKIRRELFDEVNSTLQQRASVRGGRQADARLRQARLLITTEEYDKALICLQQFIDLRPDAKLGDALELLSNISTARGEPELVVPSAQVLVRLIDVNALSQAGINRIVDLLEGLGMYNEALGVVKGRMSLIERLSRYHADLIVRRMLLEERLNHRDAAIESMEQLEHLECNREMGTALSRLIALNLQRSDYASIEEWIQRFASELHSASEDLINALYALYESKYWQERPLAQQLFVGAAAVQAGPDNPRAQSVELRMAHSIEAIRLYGLAISYYNRIGLLNFLQGDELDDMATVSVGEQAVLGKARCLKKLGDWVAANKLYRGLCQRTRSPMVKSEAASSWAEIALRDGQKIEAERRYNLVHAQMLSEVDQVHHMLGQMQLADADPQNAASALEANLELLANLPREEQRDATIAFFNQTFDLLYRTQDERTMLRLVDLACQSQSAQWLPIESYVLRMCDDKLQLEQIEDLKTKLDEINEVANPSMGDFRTFVDRLSELSKIVKMQ